jgi:hypothetical protein
MSELEEGTRSRKLRNMRSLISLVLQARKPIRCSRLGRCRSSSSNGLMLRVIGLGSGSGIGVKPGLLSNSRAI